MMEKCNTYNTENLPPATSLVYFGITKTPEVLASGVYI